MTMTIYERRAILERYGLDPRCSIKNSDVAEALQRAEQRTPLEKAAKELLEACEALTRREWVGHNATCICCRQTKYRGHATLCQWVNARAVIALAEPSDQQSKPK
jgi:hypothetical protein